MVIRTGWDDWQRFLVKETEDPLKFPACLEGWRSKGIKCPYPYKSVNS